MPVLVAEAGALPGVAVPAVAAAAHRGVVEVHVVSLVVGRLVALVADHAGLVLCVERKNGVEGSRSGEREMKNRINQSHAHYKEH